jgi:hypothetical protein
MFNVFIVCICFDLFIFVVFYWTLFFVFLVVVCCCLLLCIVVISSHSLLLGIVAPCHHALLMFFIARHYYFSLPCIVFTTPRHDALLLFLSSSCIVVIVTPCCCVLLFLIKMHCCYCFSSTCTTIVLHHHVLLCSPSQCVLLLILLIYMRCYFSSLLYVVILFVDVCCCYPSLLCIIVVFHCRAFLLLHGSSLVCITSTPQIPSNLLLLLGSSLLCTTTIPPHCLYGSTLLIWYYPSPLLPCRWKKRNKKLQVQVFSRWVFKFFIFYSFHCVYLYVCVLWTYMDLDFFLLYLKKWEKNDISFRCKCLWMFCFHFHCINMLKIIKHQKILFCKNIYLFFIFCTFFCNILKIDGFKWKWKHDHKWKWKWIKCQWNYYLKRCGKNKRKLKISNKK